MAQYIYGETDHKFCQGINGPCENLGKWRRRNTQYTDDKDNYVFMCDQCFEAEEAYWAERWEEYYASVL